VLRLDILAVLAVVVIVINVAVRRGIFLGVGVIRSDLAHFVLFQKWIAGVS